jgi:hypothetical protein
MRTVRFVDRTGTPCFPYNVRLSERWAPAFACVMGRTTGTSDTPPQLTTLWFERTHDPDGARYVLRPDQMLALPILSASLQCRLCQASVKVLFNESCEERERGICRECAVFGSHMHGDRQELP